MRTIDDFSVPILGRCLTPGCASADSGDFLEVGLRLPGLGIGKRQI